MEFLQEYARRRGDPTHLAGPARRQADVVQPSRGHLPQRVRHVAQRAGDRAPGQPQRHGEDDGHRHSRAGREGERQLPPRFQRLRFQPRDIGAGRFGQFVEAPAECLAGRPVRGVVAEFVRRLASLDHADNGEFGSHLDECRHRGVQRCRLGAILGRQNPGQFAPIGFDSRQMLPEFRREGFRLAAVGREIQAAAFHYDSVDARAQPLDQFGPGEGAGHDLDPIGLAVHSDPGRRDAPQGHKPKGKESDGHSRADGGGEADFHGGSGVSENRQIEVAAKG